MTYFELRLSRLVANCSRLSSVIPIKRTAERYIFRLSFLHHRERDANSTPNDYKTPPIDLTRLAGARFLRISCIIPDYYYLA